MMKNMYGECSVGRDTCSSYIRAVQVQWRYDKTPFEGVAVHDAPLVNISSRVNSRYQSKTRI
jgi:hypothetical protein